MSQMIDGLIADSHKVYLAVINHPLLPSMEDCASILNPLEDMERRLCKARGE